MSPVRGHYSLSLPPPQIRPNRGNKLPFFRLGQGCGVGFRQFGGGFADEFTEYVGREFGDIEVTIPIFGLNFQSVYAATRILRVMFGQCCYACGGRVGFVCFATILSISRILSEILAARSLLPDSSASFSAVWRSERASSNKPNAPLTLPRLK